MYTYIYIWPAHPSRLTVAHPSHPTPPHRRLSQSSLRTLIPPRSTCPNPPLPTPPASPDHASPHPAAPMHPAMFTPWHEAPVRNPVFVDVVVRICVESSYRQPWWSWCCPVIFDIVQN